MYASCIYQNMYNIKTTKYLPTYCSSSGTRNKSDGTKYVIVCSKTHNNILYYKIYI